MQPLLDLARGIEILEPFLTQHGFEFDNYETGKGSEGNSTVVTFINGRKKFTLSYGSFIEQVVYQYDDAEIRHDAYLDQLGQVGKKNLNDFHYEDKLLAFRLILYDFEYLIDDFFDGECRKLLSFSKLRTNAPSEPVGKTREELDLHLDKARIEEARLKFKNKDFKSSMEIYNTVESKNLLNALDNRLIDFCEKHNRK
ncbi:MAG TPA: hypothetical protein VGK38_02345 [Prolixibacteraceae bacterium]|jgi:hypothetical protein